VILVHGLWLNGLDMSLLRRRLEKAGFLTHQFFYQSRQAAPAENALALQAFLQKVDAQTVHYVCHSLGGLIIRHLFHNYPDREPGRIVCLGTPHQASRAANTLYRIAPGRWLLGRCIEQGLLGDIPPWKSTHDLGVIAGNLRLGMGLLIPGIPKPSDGTVAVQETVLEGMTDHIVLPVSHFGMLLSSRVAGQTVNFLKDGRFQHHSADMGASHG
jgi:pimeloyl-ACP methyl ester carboxylesterase